MATTKRFRAKNGLDNGNNTITGVGSAGSTIDLAGNLTTSGANALTLTTTGSTNVTLPTTGTIPSASGASGAVAWYSGTSTLSSKVAQLYWDNTNNRLGIGTGTPGAKVHALGTSEQLRLDYDGGNWASFTVDSAGNLTMGYGSTSYAGTADLTISHANVTISGNLTVNGTTTTINSTTLAVDDINIILGDVASPSNTTANGGGITLKGATDKTIIWDSTNSNWTSSENWNLATGKTFKINNVDVLSATTLGANVVSSSLTSVGTLTTGTWSATTIATNKGGTGLTSFTSGGAVYATSTSALTTGTLPTTAGGTGLSSIGTSLQVLRVNSGGTALEYATISTGSGDVILANNNAFTGANTFTNSTGQIFRQAATQDGVLVRGRAGGTSSYTVELIPATLSASVVLTLPAATDTLVGRATTDTLTNKTLTSPTLTTPVLGTPSSGTLTNCTGLPVSGITASTTTALGVGSIELGHASDTTIARASAGVVTIEGVNVVTVSSTDTLTNKTLTSPTLTTPVLGTPSSGTLTNCTGLPVSGITASTTTALGVGSIELGHASDTTIARSSAGVVTIEGNQVVTLSSTIGTIKTATLTTSATTANQVLDTNATASYRSVLYFIQITSGTSYHSTQISVIHDGTTAYINEYGTVSTADIATFDADISGGNLRLLTTPTNAVTVYKVIAKVIAV